MDMGDLIETIKLVFIPAAIIFTLVFAFVVFVESEKCSNYQELTGRSTTYKICGGCFVETQNGWFTMGQYSKIIIAREGLQSQNTSK